MGSNTIPFPKLDSGVKSNAGLNPSSIIEELTHSAHSPQEMQQLATAAATPIPGGHSQNVPFNLQPSQTSFSPAQAPQRPQPVGKGNARGQGIGNAVIGVINAISGVKVADNNKKKLQVATDTQTLLTAQSQIDANRQILQNDPNNSAAKDAIQHNMQIMNGILSDPKTREAIGKGFKIDFTNPQANNTPDHQAVQQGKQMAEKTQALSYGEQFNKGVPSQVTPNVPAIARYQQAQIEQKSQEATLKALASIISAQIRAGGQYDLEKFKQDAQNFRTAYATNARAMLEQDKFINAQKLEGIKYSHESQLAVQKANLALRNVGAAMDMKDTDPINILTKSATSLSDMQRASAQIESRIDAVQHNLDTTPNPTNTKDETATNQRAELRQELEALKHQKTSLDNSYKDTKTLFDNMILSGGKNGGAGSTNNNTDPDAEDDDPDTAGDQNSLDYYLSGATSPK